MSEKEIDLNKLREQAKKGEVQDKELEHHGINTRERFEALSPEEQIRFMERKGYTDMELFKQRHFPKNDTVDINKLREQVRKMEEDKK